LIYATSPQKELVAAISIDSVASAPIELLWQAVRESACLSEDEFDRYFSGKSTGVVIRLGNFRKFERPISLSALRFAWEGFQPPQGFGYLEFEDLAKLKIPELHFDPMAKEAV
jgi:predicted transcriptional regulator